EPEEAVPATNIVMGDFGALDSSGNAYKKVSGGDKHMITPSVKNKDYYGLNGPPYKLKHGLSTWTHYPALTDTNRARLNLGVGEEVDLSGMPANTVWSGPGLLATNGSVTFIAPSNAPLGGMSATVIATVGSASIAVPFKVFPPSGIDHADVISTNDPHYDLGQAGAAMHLQVYIAPTSVSFYRVQCMEVGENAINVWGCFTNSSATNLYHSTANTWFPLSHNNSWVDGCFLGVAPIPLYGGGFSWDIPAKWKIEEPTNSMTGWNQVFSIDASGTVNIQKFGHEVTRSTNGVITVN
ncbi:MAG TPA: hypothetical protein VFF11_06805, partial [Candidatus Binatia bacterium]|nr:hypothetical protein [Candidatus Binatia bacterium]